MLDISLKGCTPKPQSQQRSWEGEGALERGGQEPAGHGSKARSCARGLGWYLEPAVDLPDTQGVVDALGLPGQLHIIGGASLHIAQCRDTGNAVEVAKEAEGDLLALSWLQFT